MTIEEGAVQVLKNADDQDFEYALKGLMREYASKGIEYAADLIKYNSQLMDEATIAANRRIRKLTASSDLLIFQNYKKLDSKTAFATMLPVCQVMFPTGYPENGSIADKDYFQRTADLLKDKKNFDWKKDFLWADSYGYTDYIKILEEYNRANEETDSHGNS